MQHALLHPLSSSNFANLVQLLSAYGFERKYIFRVLYLSGLCLLRQPGQLLDSIRFHKEIEKQVIEPDPVFIIGHWRSGTTYLQNLLCQDPQFGRVSLLQASMPHDFMTLPAIYREIFRRILPARRIMDNVKLSLDMPWEEEMAMASYCAYSFYHVSFFPRCIEAIFQRAVLFDGGKPEYIAIWKRCYLNFLKKIQFTQPGRRLLLKNPANTARIGILRQLFPTSRFIHIHRHPYEVFKSTMHLYSKVQSAWGLQSIDGESLAKHVLASYRELMHGYFSQCAELNKQDLVAIRYEELERNPSGTIKMIYQQLELENYAIAEPHFLQYIKQQRDYEKNSYAITEAEKELVYAHWQEAFTRLGYEK